MAHKRKWLATGIVLTIGLLVAAFFVATTRLNDARDYVGKTLPALTQNWDEGVLRRELNREKFSDADVKHIAQLGRKELGQLTSFTVHRATISTTNVGGNSSLRLCYAVPAKFSKADWSGMTLSVAFLNGRWQLVDFDVTDPHDQRNNLFKPAPAAVFIFRQR